MGGHGPGVLEAGGAHIQHKVVCKWTERGTVSGIPLGRWAGALEDGPDSSHCIVPTSHAQKKEVSQVLGLGLLGLPVCAKL